jgi:hypothetical protein
MTQDEATDVPGYMTLISRRRALLILKNCGKFLKEMGESPHEIGAARSLQGDKRAKLQDLMIV